MQPADGVEKQSSMLPELRKVTRGWQPGQSGNPKGRPPKGKALAELIHEQTEEGKLLVSLLVDTITDPLAKPTDRISAAKELLDRGWGKPHQTIESESTVHVDDTNWEQIFLDRVATLAKRVGQGNGSQGTTQYSLPETPL